MARRVGCMDGWAPIVMLAGVVAASALGCAGTKPRAASGGEGGAAGGGLVSGGGGDAGSSATDGPPRMIGADPLGNAACATATQKAEQVPLDIYIMMDSSGSMADPVSNNSTTTKWTAVKNALTAFLQDPKSTGLGVGLQYFPLLQPTVPDVCDVDRDCGNYGPCSLINACSTAMVVTPCQSNADCGPGLGTCARLGQCSVSNGFCAPAGYTCTGGGGTCAAIPGYCSGRDKCDSASYATPDVEVAALPGAATALLASLNQHMPDGLTPTAGALSGAILHAQALARSNPMHKVVVLLATDGLPSECNPQDTAGVSMIAANARAGAPSIATYVIGVFGASDTSDGQTNLDAIAASGGTGKAFVVNTAATADVAQAFLSALNSVRLSGQSCQYMVPTTTGDDAGQIDYYRINVRSSSSTSGVTYTIGNVKDRASCSPTEGGWYYDVDPSTGQTPATITLCDKSCAQLQSDPGVRIDVLLGCKTVLIIN